MIIPLERHVEGQQASFQVGALTLRRYVDEIEQQEPEKSQSRDSSNGIRNEIEQYEAVEEKARVVREI